MESVLFLRALRTVISRRLRKVIASVRLIELQPDRGLRITKGPVQTILLGVQRVASGRSGWGRAGSRMIVNNGQYS
jgi:hypothetical protein